VELAVAHFGRKERRRNTAAIEIKRQLASTATISIIRGMALPVSSYRQITENCAELERKPAPPQAAAANSRQEMAKD